MSNALPLAHRAVFLDRDGVLNEPIVREGKPYPPDSADELVIMPGAEGALAALKAAGFLLIVVTNQPDVGRGKQTVAAVEQIHKKLRTALPVDRFMVCYHDDRDACNCRKPKPGMLLQAAGEEEVDLGRSFMIGDRWRDVDAGAAAGCRTVLIDYGYDERQPDHAPDARVKNLGEAVRWILRVSNGEC
jgi:D-glycero-D-manno-heptose 1,7-bisphosphate phosphatase